MGLATAIGIGASVLGASNAKRSADKARKAQVKSADASIAEQRRQYDQTREDNMPYMQAGTNALARLENPTESFQASPGYDFVKREGMEGIQGSAAARGSLYSGNALKALNEYNSGLASQEYGNWWNRQAGLVNAGRGATMATGAAGQGAANNVSNALMSQGQARAEGAYQTGAAIDQGLNNALYATGRYLGSRPTPRVDYRGTVFNPGDDGLGTFDVQTKRRWF